MFKCKRGARARWYYWLTKDFLCRVTQCPQEEAHYLHTFPSYSHLAFFKTTTDFATVVKLTIWVWRAHPGNADQSEMIIEWVR